MERDSDTHLLLVALAPILLGLLAGTLVGTAIGSPRGRRAPWWAGGCLTSIVSLGVGAYYLLMIFGYGFANAPGMREPDRSELQRTMNFWGIGFLGGFLALIVAAVAMAVFMHLRRRRVEAQLP